MTLLDNSKYEMISQKSTLCGIILDLDKKLLVTEILMVCSCNYYNLITFTYNKI